MIMNYKEIRDILFLFNNSIFHVVLLLRLNTIQTCQWNTRSDGLIFYCAFVSRSILCLISLCFITCKTFAINVSDPTVFMLLLLMLYIKLNNKINILFRNGFIILIILFIYR